MAAPATIHTVAASGFTAAGAALYNKGRPDWQTDHVARVADLAGLTAAAQPATPDGLLWPATPIVELACGTGKFTRPFLAELQARAPPGARVNLICVEPTSFSDAIADLVESGAVRLITAPADAMTELATGSACAVIAAQAFHWFADDASCVEISRVLAPGAPFIAAWNGRDLSETGAPWVRAHEDIIDRAYAETEGATPRYQSRRWEAVIRAQGAHFEQPPAITTWPREGGGHVATLEQHLASTMSISVIARRPQEVRDAFERELRAVLATAPTRAPAAEGEGDGSGAAVIVLPMYAECMLVRRRSGSVAPAAAAGAGAGGAAAMP